MHTKLDSKSCRSKVGEARAMVPDGKSVEASKYGRQQQMTTTFGFCFARRLVSSPKQPYPPRKIMMFDEDIASCAMSSSMSDPACNNLYANPAFVASLTIQSATAC